MLSTEETLRMTLAVCMKRCGERQTDLAAALGQAQNWISRRLSGSARITLDDVDALAAHYGMPVLDLLAGPDHAMRRIPQERLAARGTQPVLTVPETLRAAAPAAIPSPPAAQEAPRSPQNPSGATEAPAGAPEVASAAPAPAQPSRGRSAAPRRTAPAAGGLADMIRDRVHAELAAHRGDLDATKAALIKRAIPDVMALFDRARVGARYEHSQFPPLAPVVTKPSQKGADAVWEARPKWRADDLRAAARQGQITLDVTTLDVNAAYLAAYKTWLPIGKLEHREGGGHDRKRSGVYRVTPPEWTSSDLPDPLGDRKSPGDLWISEPTLRQLLECTDKGLCGPPEIHESWTSGATESFLEKMRRALVEVRKEAIANGDEVTVEYVKSMYSKFVSTIGESSMNRELRRPEWTHIIRAQAHANLWRRAYKAHTAGLTVIQISGTDELHVTGDWRTVFTEGRDLKDMKVKNLYTLGGE